ncbi:MAG: urea carboxylase-associated family protein [Aquabacterium sp.]|uniref:urea amidolyase associated protein UAAP1 n=1 Tax=Aquabacterium sp. TaxID=1872578 RepID=UPI0025B7A843|nr:urea amidolyase associated protein UAAP1 [Aquabacterium sp.]MBI5924002.1 urea carboxylase-associated family protein [Aquabacterium sp.]
MRADEQRSPSSGDELGDNSAWSHGCGRRDHGSPGAQDATDLPFAPSASQASSQAVDALPHWQRFAPELPAARVMWSEIVPGGGHWSYVMPRGSRLRMVALDAGANLSMVLYHAREKLERYNMPDSLKAQHTAHYTRGHVLMSDMGRALASITEDSLGWHDPMGALLDAQRLHAQYGERSFHTHRNAMYRSGKDGLLIEIGKYGLSRRDLIAPVNFFSKVSVDAEGRFRFATRHAAPGAMVELRFDMDTLIAFSTAPHPLDPSAEYAPGKVGLAAWKSGPALPDDFNRAFRPECARALHNADMSYL